MGKIEFSRKKAHPLDFDYFPAKLLGKDGRAIASVEISPNGSNATVRWQWPKGAGPGTTTNILYSTNRAKFGEIRFHPVVTVSFTNQAGRNSTALAVTNYAAVIQLDETNFPAIKRI